MREGVTVEVSAADRARLEAIVADRNSRQKHVWRSRIVLLTADWLGTNEIMRRVGKSKVTVWRWQERFMQAGGRGTTARQDAAAAHPAPTGEHARAHCELDPRRAAGRDDVLDGGDDGASRRHQ